MITPQAISLDQAKAPKLLDQVRDKIRLKHYSIRTEQTYVDWIKRLCFVSWYTSLYTTLAGRLTAVQNVFPAVLHHKRYPAEMGAAEVETFLTHLAVEGKVAPSTQNQCKVGLAKA
jgi:hypothetical protein